MSAALCTWDAVEVTGRIDGYNVYLKSGTVFAKVNTSAITGTSYTITGLAPQSYSAYCTAFVNENESDPSNIATFTLTFDDKYKPENLDSTVTGSGVDLTWDYVPGIEAYNVYLDGVKQNTSLIYSNEFTITGLSSDTYDWYVSSVYDGSEVNSNTEEFTIA